MALLPRDTIPLLSQARDLEYDRRYLFRIFDVFWNGPRIVTCYFSGDINPRIIRTV